ncbi:MAG: hypothetical protein QNJ55_01305 [Xenococcus sp. MO_188.B8]|nr:hypothetical protein [Xenococcus sp. MO_188.B8]
MNNQTIHLERYEIISTVETNNNFESVFGSKIYFNNIEKTSFPDLEREALLIRCLFLLRDLFYLNTDALIEASNELKDIVIYYQDCSNYSRVSLPATRRIITGEITKTEISKPPRIEF